MASRSQEPPTTTASATKSRTSKAATQEASTTTASTAKSRTSKTAAKESASTAASAPKSKTSKTAAPKAPSTAASVAKSVTRKAAAAQEPAATTASAPRSAPGMASTESEVSVNTAESRVALPDDLRAQWIAQAAYFIAERRGFSGGSADDDWREAEMEIDRMLAATRH